MLPLLLVALRASVTRVMAGNDDCILGFLEILVQLQLMPFNHIFLDGHDQEISLRQVVVDDQEEDHDHRL